ncbi:hypothetical protein [Lachnobacterium bovis]|uniref:Uncharacterized protein n=1 Tax=Lachnobacterium bovis TaxID=140626 RepID=A0A1H9TMA6_9FIRM|nr:hypothetical protein [Lachnobacterium bovis]SER98251.1 hypothetical protein SAMN02910429_01690 [Lachnobacterium bovis]
MKKEGIRFQKDTENRDLILDYDDIDSAKNASEDIMEITIEPKAKFPKEFNENLTEVFNESLTEESKPRQQRFVTRTRNTRTQRVSKIKKDDSLQKELLKTFNKEKEEVDHKQISKEDINKEQYKVTIMDEQQKNKIENVDEGIRMDNTIENSQEKLSERKNVDFLDKIIAAQPVEQVSPQQEAPQHVSPQIMHREEVKPVQQVSPQQEAPQHVSPQIMHREEVKSVQQISPQQVTSQPIYQQVEPQKVSKSNVMIVDMSDTHKEGEKNMDVDSVQPKSDGLLKQIDEFREKAKMLQTLIQSKKDEAKKLEDIVAEKENKAEKLQRLVNERQEKADGITGEVSKRIKEMEKELVERINTIENNIDFRLQESSNHTSAMNNQLKETVTDSNSLALKKIDERLENVVTSKEIEGIVEEQLEETKIVLSEKIHSEDVKLYRNTKDALKDIEQQLYNIENVKDNTNSVKGLLKGVMALSLINLAGIVVMALYMFGFIHLS